MNIGDRIGYQPSGQQPTVGTVQSFSHDKTWCYIQVDGLEGWVCVMPELDKSSLVAKMKGLTGYV